MNTPHRSETKDEGRKKSFRPSSFVLRLLDVDTARWIMLVVWMGVIFYLSAQPQLPSLPEYDTLFKKTAHFCAYGLLAVLAQRALYRQRYASIGAWLLAVLYAISDEWHQSFVPGRHPAATDVLIDGAGALCALLAWRWLSDRFVGHRARSEKREIELQ